MKTNEITALAFVMANREWSDDGVSTSTIRADMERAGFTLLAAGLALTSLERQGFLSSAQEHSGNYNDEPWTVYKLTNRGEDWLLDNQEQLELSLQPSAPTQRRLAYEHGITDEDVPF